MPGQKKFKYSPPPTQNIIHRERVMELLARSDKRNLVFLTAPSGSGKSTLIADYLASKAFPTIWYNLERSDNDPANFFGSFREGIPEGLTKKAFSFPVFSVEYIPSIESYSRKFFLHLLRIVPANTAIVLDNAQCIQMDSILQRIVRVLAETIRRGKRLYIISRQPVSLSGSDWSIEGRSLRLDWGHIRLEDEEAREFLRRRCPDISEAEASEIIRRSDGWIASLSLFNRTDRPVPDEKPLLPASVPGGGLCLRDQELEGLSLVAELPEISPDLTGFLGDDEKRTVFRILESLSDENLFVMRLAPHKRIFFIHDLFREYLKNAAREKLAPERYSACLSGVAASLRDAGYYTDALRVYHKLNAHDKIMEILRQKALEWAYSGRVFTIMECLGLIQETPYSEDPWAAYLKASTSRFTEPASAINLYRHALEGFEEKGDLAGQKAVIAEMLDTAQYYGEDFSLTGCLLDDAERIMETLACSDRPTPVDAMLPAYAGVMYLLYRGDSSRAVECFDMSERFMAGMEGMELIKAYVRMYSAVALGTAGEARRAEAAFNEATRIFKNAPEHPPHTFMFHFLASIHEAFAGRFADCVKRMEEAIPYARSWGLHVQEEHLHVRLLEGLLSLGLTEKAEEVFREIERLGYRNSFSMAMTYQIEAQLYLLKHDPHMAALAAERSIDLFEKIHADIFAGFARGVLGVTLAEMGKYEGAAGIFNAIIEWARANGNWMQVFTTLLHRAWMLLVSGKQQDAIRDIHDALALGQQRAIHSSYFWLPYMMSTLLAAALQHGIQSEYARSLIRYHNLQPPDDVLSELSWPWRIRIHAFGSPEVFREDRPVKQSEWKGEMTFKLLLAIVSSDALDVPAATVMDLLWPDADGDRAKQNLEFTLRKLRRVLCHVAGDKPVIIWKSGILSMNTDIAYIDIHSFRRHAELAESLFIEGKDEEAVFHAEKAALLYRGKLLQGHDEAWICNRRKHWHKRYMGIMEQLLSCRSRMENWEGIVPLCRKALKIDPSSELICYYLMKSLLNLGEKAEAERVYNEFTELACASEDPISTERLSRLLNPTA